MSSRLKEYTIQELRTFGITTLCPDYFALIQVCRQNRQEYSPIYFAEAKTMVF
jgi:hypothetical protein